MVQMLQEGPSTSKGANDAEDPQQQQNQQQQQQMEMYDDADDDDQMIVMDPEYEKYLRERNEETMQQMRALMEKMTPEQQTRYETYRSAALPKQAMRKFMQTVLSQNIPERMVIMVAGVAKLHLGQLVETGI